MVQFVLNNEVRIGVIGAGVFGTMMIVQLARMRGLKPSIVADINIKYASQALELAQIRQNQNIEVNTTSQANTAMDEKKSIVTRDANVLIQSDIDIVVEATGNAEVGSQ